MMLMRMYRDRVGVGADWEFGESFGDPVYVPETPVTDVEASIAALLPFVSPARLALFNSVLAQRTSRVRVAYERPSNPHNVWACLRTIDAFGVQNVDVVRDTEDEAQNRARKRGAEAGGYSLRASSMTTALGAQKWLTLQDHPTPGDMCRSLRQQGYTLAATDLSEGSVDLSSFLKGDLDKVALIFGNEEVGISDETRKLADARVAVPMRGFADSLNLSVSTGVVLAHLASLGFLEPDMEEKDQQKILLTWLTRSVKAAPAILKRHGLGVE